MANYLKTGSLITVFGFPGYIVSEYDDAEWVVLYTNQHTGIQVRARVSKHDVKAREV